MASVSIASVAWEFETGPSVKLKATITVNNDETIIGVYGAVAADQNDLPANAMPPNGWSTLQYNEATGRYESISLMAPERATMKVRAYLQYSKIAGSAISTLGA